MVGKYGLSKKNDRALRRGHSANALLLVRRDAGPTVIDPALDADVILLRLAPPNIYVAAALIVSDEVLVRGQLPGELEWSRPVLGTDWKYCLAMIGDAFNLFAASAEIHGAGHHVGFHSEGQIVRYDSDN